MPLWHDLGMRPRLVRCTLLAAFVAAGCEAPTPEPEPRATAPAVDVSAACAALHDAMPHEWGAKLVPVVAAGRRSEAPLVALVNDRPGAPGAQASVAALGRVGGDAAVGLCRRLVRERAPLAVEAALALGELPGAAEDEDLIACVVDRHGDATLRTACACALARRGEREHAPRFLMAIVRAGTPAGLRDEQELGVPSKTRWARERYFVQRALLALGHRDLCDRLDTDAPWPALEKLAPVVRARLEGR